MDGKNDVDKVDDMLPGFRFHPTDEEIVGFYLQRKILQRPLPIELIKQVDIYKYDPWDLPKLASTGEKEWYFYCPRDRKYRNSARPNRVTVAGFWKATGTDRPIYSSDGTKCIGLKKSLVFYRGRAAKGIKTDWMMHEFRLPSLSDPAPQKKFIDKSIPANDSWAICRIFKKANSMAQRALSHSWVSSLPKTLSTDMVTQGTHCSQFSSENISCTTEIGSAMQFCTSNHLQQASTACFSAFHDIPSYKPISPVVSKPPLFPVCNGDLSNGYTFSPLEVSGQTKCTIDSASILVNPAFGSVTNPTETLDFEGPEPQFSGFSVSLPQDIQENMGTEEDEAGRRNSGTAVNNQWATIRSIGFPFSLPSSDACNLPWDSPPCPSEISSSYSTTKCYT